MGNRRELPLARTAFNMFPQIYIGANPLLTCNDHEVSYVRKENTPYPS